MSQFEFVFIPVSIILGLALANLLNGISRVARQPWRDVDGIHLAFSFGIILTIFVVWWGMYRWQGHGQFDFETFMVIGVYTSTFYLISVTLFPRDGTLVGFEHARVPFYLALILMFMLEIAYYAVGDFDPASYYTYVLGIAFTLFGASIWLQQRWLDKLIVVYWFVVYGGWWVITKF